MLLICLIDFFIYTPFSVLPAILSFDEKHIGKAISNHKYLFIILDWINKKINEIIDSRDKNTLWKYFSSISKEQRDKVLYVTMDMWSTYMDIVKHFFKNAKIMVDSFHIMENINRTMSIIRCIVMAKYNRNTEILKDNHLSFL